MSERTVGEGIAPYDTWVLRVFHCCGWAMRVRTPTAENPFFQDIVPCPSCLGRSRAEISEATLAAYQLGGWDAIVEPGSNGRYGKLLDFDDAEEYRQ